MPCEFYLLVHKEQGTETQSLKALQSRR
jgi:hypothetical protein